MIFRRSLVRPVAEAPSHRSSATLPIAGPWRIAFHDGRGAPTDATFATLASWTENENPGIKFTPDRHLPHDLRCCTGQPPRRVTATLDLGTVADLAEVRINGALIGTLWQPPFRADVTRHLRAGEITLRSAWPTGGSIA